MKYLLYFLFFVCCTACTPKVTSVLVEDLKSPVDWIGTWSGELVIYTGQGEQQRLPMKLKIHPIPDSTDMYTYHIVYGEDTPENTRPYLLRTLDASIGHYEVDEVNGIVLDDYVLGNKLYSRFEVMGSLLLSTVESRGDQLLYEIISGPLDPIRTTGDIPGATEEEMIPPVNGYQIRVRQYAVLTKELPVTN